MRPIEQVMEERRLKLDLLPGTYAVCRLNRDAPVPDWATAGLFCSVTRTAEELSVVCPDTLAPERVTKDSGWKVLMIEGPLDLSLTGVLASLAAPLARAEISIFAISTYDTDYLMVKNQQAAEAIQVLRAEGYCVEGESGVVRSK